MNGWERLCEFDVYKNDEIQEQNKDWRFIKGYYEIFQFSEHINYRSEPALKYETNKNQPDWKKYEFYERNIFLKLCHFLLVCFVRL